MIYSTPQLWNAEHQNYKLWKNDSEVKVSIQACSFQEIANFPLKVSLSTEILPQTLSIAAKIQPSELSLSYNCGDFVI